MWRLLLRRSALVFLVFYFLGVNCSRRGHDRGAQQHYHRHPRKNKNIAGGGKTITKPYQWKHRSLRTHLNKNSLLKSPKRENFLLDRRDFVPKQLFPTATTIDKKQNVFEKYYESQRFRQVGDEKGISSTIERNLNGGTLGNNSENTRSNGAKARNVMTNDLGYSDFKTVEDADESVNEVINSIINDDKNLEKSMSDETEYVAKPTRSPADDFDVAIDENTPKISGGSSYVPSKWTTKVDALPGQQGGSDQITSNYSDGKTKGTQSAHSWSVRLESASSSNNQDNHTNSPGSHGNGEDIKSLNEETYSENITNQIGNAILQSSQGGPGKESNDSNTYKMEDGNKMDDLTKLNLNANGSFLPRGENDQIKSTYDNGNTGDIITTQALNFGNEATGRILSENNILISSINRSNHGEEVANNESSQNPLTMAHLPGVKDESDNIVTDVISALKDENTPIRAQSDVSILGNTSDENSARNSSNIISQNITDNRTRFDNEDVYLDSHSHGTRVTTDNNNSSISNNDNVNLDISESMTNQEDQNQGHMDDSRNSNLSIANADISDHDHQQNEATPSSFLKQHPNAFKVLMEYFRKEASLQQKLRDRLNALRKTKITEENAMKKSFASVHELEAMPTRPLPLRDFVADLFKYATENVPSKADRKNGLKAKASEQGVLKDEGTQKAERKSGRRRHSMVGAPRKIAGKLHNVVQPPKQSLPSRKADVTFLADFENVTEVAKEINGNISKIFQDAMNSNSQENTSSEPNTSSAVGQAEERIGKIIAQNEIPQNVIINAESNTSNTKGYASFVNNNENEMNGISNRISGSLEGNAITVQAKDFDGSYKVKVEATGPVESNVMPNAAPFMSNSNAISKAGTDHAPKESIQAPKETYSSAEQTSPSEALDDFIHGKNDYMDSKTMMYKKGLKSLEASLSQDFFNFWMYHYRSFEEMSIKPEQLRSGIATIGSTDRLERVIKKALKGQRINILIVGGSISAGGGLERDRHDLHGIYYKAFVEWWKNTVTPITTSGLKLNVVAIGGTDSEYFSYCIKNYIHEEPDLVIWELAANDYRRYAGREMDPAKPLEQLTRLLLTLPSQPALIFINFFRGDYYKTTLGQDCPDSEDEGGRIMAEYYKITSLSWRNIICSQMKLTNERPSDGAKREYSSLTLKTLFSSDGYHPSLLGHAQCATLLISYIRSVFEEVVSREISRLDAGKVDGDTNLDQRNLPNPIYGDPVAPNPLCWTLLTPDFHHQIENQLPNMRIIEANGFEFTNITRWPVRMDRLRCLKALHSDASLRIKFDILRETNDKASTQKDVAVISHNSFSGSARVWLDNDQNDAVMFEEPSGQRRTQVNIIKRVLQPGSHVITIRSITPGFCVSAIAIL